MVSTRGHPKAFPEPDLTPSRSSTPSKSLTPSRARKGKWAHAPSTLTLIWLLTSLPLVAWDTGYVMLRPHSMPGGKLQWPLWVPYELYVEMDYIYGWKAFNEHNGFTAAQGLLNIIESLMYVYYLYIVYALGRKATAGRGAKATDGGLLAQRLVEGQTGALAALVVFSAAVMTLSKTVLYWSNEYFSGFSNIGHNPPHLLLLWIVTNGAWLILPAYITYLTGSEILQGLAIAGGASAPADAKNE